MNKRQARHRRLCVSRRVLGFILGCVVAGLQTVIAQDRGNTSAQEYGDPVYRVLEGIAGFAGYNYNHTAIFGGLDSSGSGRVLQALGSGYTTHETSFSTAFASYGSDYYGAYTLNNRTMSFTDRKKVVKTARDLVDANIPYPALPPYCLQFYGMSFDGSDEDISNIRCDGFVEYAYEFNNFRVWRNQSYADSTWSITNSVYVDYHNDRPDMTRNPEREASPWAQRGAPCATGPSTPLGCSYSAPDTKMNRPAVTNLPTYEVTAVSGSGYVDVTIRATDESGIHYIGYREPGDATWYYSDKQPQHPTSDSFAFAPIRITASGMLYVFAVDNGGNFPDDATGYTITVTSVVLPSVETRTVVDADIGTTTATIRGRVFSDGGSAISDRRFDWGLSTPLTQAVFSDAISVSGNDFSTTLTGLSPNTTYFFRAWTRNGSSQVGPCTPTPGWGCGNILSFTTKSINQPQPDLTQDTAGLAVVPVRPGDTIAPSITLRNQSCSSGNAAAGPFHVGFYWSTDTSFNGVSPLYETAVDSCSVGGTVSINPNITVPSAAPGTYYFGYRIDSRTELAECDLNNNGVFYWTLTVPPPDTTLPTVSISSPTSGQIFTSTPIMVSGSASDPGNPSSGVALVEVRVNGGDWQTANLSLPDWSRSVNVGLDSNVIEARSRDNANNYSMIDSISVTLSSVPYTITASAGTGGNISPSGSIPKAVGSSQIFTASPSVNYVVNQWLVDGAVVQTGGTSYTLSNIQGSRSVEVTFTYQAPPQGRINFTTRVNGVYSGHVYGPEGPMVVRKGNTSSELPVGTQTYAGGLLLGSGWSAQLFGGPLGSQENTLSAIGDPTTFRTTAAAAGLIIPLSGLVVPGMFAGESGTFQVRAWDNEGGTVNSWGAAVRRGASDPFVVPSLGGGLFLIPDLENFRSFNVAGPLKILIVTQPENQAVIAGQNATFMVSASVDSGVIGSSMVPEYQWRFKGMDIVGATSSEYTVINAQTENSGEYSVVLTGARDWWSRVTSSNAVLTVNVPPPTPVTINWVAPTDIVYGTVLASTHLNATATSFGTNVAGAFIYSPEIGTVLGAGNVQTLSVTFTPTDAAHYLPAAASVSISVLKAPLVVAANNRTKTYGQAVTFAGTEFTASGLVGSDTVTGVALTSGGAGTTAAVAGSPYSINASSATGAGLGNYTISYQNGTFTISPAALTVTANNRSKTYGQAVTFAGTEFTTSGLRNSETVGLVTLTSSGTAAAASVGSHSITPSGATGGTFNPGNYTITYQNGILAVSPAPLTPPQLTSMALSNGVFRFVLNGPVGNSYVVQVSSNLINWLPLVGDSIPVSGSVLITDPIIGRATRLYRAVVGDTSIATTNIALISAGNFTMGNSMATNEGDGDELPLHSVYVSAFYMDKHAVTKALWDDVYNWATNHGYSFEYGAQGKTNDHPVHSMTWYDAVKWCNARSEKEGRTPAYYTDAGLEVRYRTGQVAVYVNWSSGYRLPTEAEWEKAARGGAGGQRFPWGDTITHGQANYYSRADDTYDLSPTRTYQPTFHAGVSPFTSPVGYFAPNAYGLYDMAGNVWEWCWDWYSSAYYSTAPGSDPVGPASGTQRAYRGGSWDGYALHCRTANRSSGAPADRYFAIGFRSVRPVGQ